MDYLASQVLFFVKAHPEWAALIIGLVAFGESFVFLSLLFPGTAILIASGALIEAGILDPFSPVVAGIVGAVLGDAISFWLGQKFGPLLSDVWPFRRHPERLENGISFFKRYGASSVFIGRFFGPLRAVIPLAAGILHMPSRRFYMANVLSAIVWAPALVFSGDLLAHSLGPQNLATKIFYVTVIAAALALLAPSVRRLFTTK
ncbi:MAG: DedA family protein [Methyloceanibacter sp.]|jgi:membrane protein DedA with SNARE-associated domain|nr:DedA family protein [Methyloceanibacter sp.]